jgi:hypothetical protein
MKNNKITCDHCNADITYTGNCVDYRILLRSEEMQSRGGAVTAMMLYPPTGHDKHFCGNGCLKNWVMDGMRK